MKKTILIILGFAAYMTAGLNIANAGGYIGADYSMISTGITDHTGYNLKAGYEFNDFLAVEGRSLVSSSDESYYGASVEIDSLYSVMLKASLPVTSSSKLYAMFGSSRGEITASYMGYSESITESSSSFGFGASYSVLEAYTLTAEYVETHEDVDMFSIGLNLNF